MREMTAEEYEICVKENKILEKEYEIFVKENEILRKENEKYRDCWLEE